MLHYEHHPGGHAGHGHQQETRPKRKARSGHGPSASRVPERGARMFSDAGGLAHFIDHTLVRSDATLDELSAACEDAKKFGFSSVVVNSSNVARARELLSGSLVKVCAVVGFPFGANTT